MNNPTKRFAWHDCDTAARDMLQLVYHAPPFVSRQALQLLQAFGSMAVVPELEAMFTDDSLDIDERRLALYAIMPVRNDLYRPQFVIYVEQVVEEWVEYEQQKPGLYWSPHEDLLRALDQFVRHHPSNHDWFFEALRRIPPHMALDYLTPFVPFSHPGEFRNRLRQEVLRLLDNHLELLKPSFVMHLVHAHHETTDAWLDANFATVVEVCLKYIEKKTVRDTAASYEKLRLALMERNADYARFVEEETQRGQAWLAERQAQGKYEPPYLSSPGYRYLDDLYQNALSGSQDAYEKLKHMTDFSVRRNVSLWAVAMHFLGKLYPQYDSLKQLLAALTLKEKWKDISLEAGNALKNVAAPKVWETMLDAFFIGSSGIPVGWIAHLTDILSDGQKEYTGYELDAEYYRPWFKALTDITEDQLQQEINRQ